MLMHDQWQVFCREVLQAAAADDDDVKLARSAFYAGGAAVIGTLTEPRTLPEARAVVDELLKELTAQDVAGDDDAAA